MRVRPPLSLHIALPMVPPPLQSSYGCKIRSSGLSICVLVISDTDLCCHLSASLMQCAIASPNGPGPCSHATCSRSWFAKAQGPRESQFRLHTLHGTSCLCCCEPPSRGDRNEGCNGVRWRHDHIEPCAVLSKAKPASSTAIRACHHITCQLRQFST